MNFFSKLFKTNKNPKKDSEYIKENFTTLIDYWSGVIEGTVGLEDGSKFSDNTIYNTKFLKYPKRYLEIACISAGKNAKDKKIFEACRTCYMWFANFSDEVKDKIVNSSQDIMDIVAKYGDDTTSLDKKDTDSLIKEIDDAPHDEKKSREIFNAISKTQMAYVKKFDELTKKDK
tara:strand:+ start:39 stop:560 length:522 start_codon:yes stop_codon:yes gene_type:complete